MNQRTVLTKLMKKIRSLNIPHRVQQGLIRMLRGSKVLLREALLFLRRHRRLTESLLLGAIVAYLLTLVPYAGGFLGAAALITFASIGLMHEFGDGVRSAFKRGE